MKKSFYLVIFILSLFLSFNSCTLTTEEDSGSLSITLPSLTMSRSGETRQNFTQLPSEYEITIGLKHSKGYVYSGIHKISENPIVINKIKPDYYVITITGHTDTHLYTDEQEIDIKPGKNEVTLNLEVHKKEILGYYVNSQASMEGNGTKTYPFKTINYALKNIPQNKEEVTLFLDGIFTETVLIDNSTPFRSITIDKSTDAFENPIIRTPSDTTDNFPGAKAAISIFNEASNVTINNIDFDVTGFLLGSDFGDNSVVNIINGNLILTNCNFNMPMISSPEGRKESPGSAISIGREGKLNLGGKINIPVHSGIRKGINTITVVSPLSCPNTIYIDQPNTSKPYPQVIDCQPHLDLAQAAQNFGIIVFDGFSEFTIKEDGFIEKTKTALAIRPDQNWQSIEVIVNNNKIMADSPHANVDSTLFDDTHTPYLFNIGQNYEITITATPVPSSTAQGETITQTHNFLVEDDEVKDYDTVFFNTNKNWYVSTAQSANDSYDGFEKSPFKTLSHAIEIIKEKTINSSNTDTAISRHTINLVFAQSPTLESTESYVIDFPCDINIIPKSEMGPPILKNDTTSVFNINHKDAKVSLSSVTIQGASQDLTNSGLINLQKGSLELINCATEGISATMNGVNVMNGTTFKLTGFVDPQSVNTYSATFNRPININEGATINVNFDKAPPQTPITVLIPSTNSYGETPLFKTPSNTLTENQRNSFRVIDDLAGGDYTIFVSGTVGAPY